MKVTNGVRVIENNVNNTEVTYPDYITQPMSPITPPKQKALSILTPKSFI